MAGTATTGKQSPSTDAPTEAQLATIADLCDALGVEAPEPVTREAAATVIETLKAAYEERDGDPELIPDPSAGDDEKPAEGDDGTAQPPPDNALSEKDAQKLFDRAVGDFGKALREVFGVDELQPSQAPGVVGFLMPGATEELPHPDFKRCTTCNGFGDVLTGSTKAGNERRPCPDPRCKGLGYWQKAGAPEPAPQTLVPVPQAAANGSGEWGEAPTWLGDPNLSGGA